ncbi:fibroblast growth factor receptor 2-like [Actinia tenebrosa]|uniref:Fibroblast growth factor receptor 2-like n=1 Tax=Actinia tenebrosa TaxID=6105 RepID=A0A6P8I0B3_ACTTE|nr:fibroblast growth factor receptor 2-like [Actinia tenebrosa]
MADKNSYPHLRQSFNIPLHLLLGNNLFLFKNRWSYGVVLWEIYSIGGSPYPTISNRQLVKELRNGYRMEKPSLCGDDIYKIMTDCWQENPEDRPSFTKIKQDIEELMTRDNPYLEVQGIDQSNCCYLVPSFNSDISETEDSIEM